MNFDYTDKTLALMEKLQAFMGKEIYPIESEYVHAVETSATPWRTPDMMHELKAKAKQQGLWNLFLPEEYSDFLHGNDVGFNK